MVAPIILTINDDRSSLLIILVLTKIDRNKRLEFEPFPVSLLHNFLPPPPVEKDYCTISNTPLQIYRSHILRISSVFPSDCPKCLV